MSVLMSLKVSDRDYAAILKLARRATDSDGAPPVSADEMAQALLAAHMVLIRDCGAVLPKSGDAPTRGPARHPGVSLGGGINAGK